MQRLPLPTLILAAAAALFSLQARAITTEQYEAISRLGELNGAALQCQYIDQTRKMKRVLIAELPKQRGLGEAFDDATQKAYLKLIEQQTPCPEPAVFSLQVEMAIEKLKQVFGTH